MDRVVVLLLFTSFKKKSHLWIQYIFHQLSFRRLFVLLMWYKFFDGDYDGILN